jgi:hypothetical protein
MRKPILLTSISLILFASLTGCSSNGIAPTSAPYSVPAKTIQKEAGNAVYGTLGYTPVIDCHDQALPAAVGATITCDLLKQNGAVYDAVITVTKVTHGKDVKFTVEASPKK